MLDLRVVVDKKDVEKVTRALTSLPLESEYGISVSSIITSSETDVIIKAGWGCDILLLGVPKEEFLQLEDVGNIERIDVSGDYEKTREEIRMAIVRSALHALRAITKVRELKQALKQQKAEEAHLKEEIQRIQLSVLDSQEMKNRMEVLQTDAEALRTRILALETDLALITDERKKAAERNDFLEAEIEKMKGIAPGNGELIVFRVEELWDEISEDVPPGRIDIEAAIRRLALEGKLFYTSGFIAASSKEDALDLLRIVKIAEDIREKG